MTKYKYVIIGGGMTGDAAVKGIREIDKEGTIALLSGEDVAPYSRPPLTKSLWKNTPEEKIWRKTPEYNVKMFLNSNVVSLNTFTNTISLKSGEELGYEKALIATGGTTIKLPFGKDDIIYYRTFSDYKKLRALTESKSNFVIIGGGFIGSEIAAALTMNGKNVSMIFPGELIGERIFHRELAEYVTGYYREKGVNVVNGDTVTSVTREENGYKIITEKKKIINADAVLGGIGIRPDTELAEKSGITVNDGIVVDEYLKTNIENIYSAGDAANFYNPLLEKRIRVEHEDNANKMGRCAGRNMAGMNEPYNYLPFFYSDMFELGYEAVGDLNPKYETIDDWKEKFKEGVIYYLNEGKVKGVLLWNVWGKVEEARKIIAENGPFNTDNLKGRLANKK